MDQLVTGFMKHVIFLVTYYLFVYLFKHREEWGYKIERALLNDVYLSI